MNMGAFSKHNPNLQTVWDASSLKAYQFCPRSYELGNLQGWQNPSVDLAFGRLIASALERYQKIRLDGSTKDDALLSVVKWAMVETWIEPSSQWGGHYENFWKCSGVNKWRNANSRVAKCPFSFKRAWFPGTPPHCCGECGSPIICERQYVPEHAQKNRQTLISAIIAYVDDQPEDLKKGLRPYVFPDGTRAVELSGKLPLPLYTAMGEQFALSWNFDKIDTWEDENYISDNKTTTKPLDDKFFRSYSIDTQFDTYDVIGSVAYPTLDITGTLVDAISVTATGIQLGRRPFTKTEAQREEHFNDLLKWLEEAKHSAEIGYWKMNKRNCWLCPFNSVCSQDPADREGYLKSHFTKGERWDPTKER